MREQTEKTMLVKTNVPLLEILNEYGFGPQWITISMGPVYMVYLYFHHTRSHKEIREELLTLISLIDKIRRLDNDIIRLRSKLNDHNRSKR